VLALLAQASQAAVDTDENESNNNDNTNDDEFVDIDTLDLNELVDPKPRALL
jgi:hypothetical protein